MGRLWGLFVVGSTALVCAAVIFSSHIFPTSWEQATQIVGGLVSGTLASVVLYVIMESIACHVRVHVVPIADWPKLRSAIFALGMYAGAALLTLGIVTYDRSHRCSGFRTCAVSLAKGVVWSAIWPIFWPVYVRGLNPPASR